MAQSSQLRNFLLSVSPAASSSEMSKIQCIIMEEVKTQPFLAVEVLERLYDPKVSDLLRRLSFADNEELVMCTVQCMDETINTLCDTELTTEQLEVLEAIGNTLVHLHYTSNKELRSTKSILLLLTTSLSLLSKIISRSSNYVKTHISELLGIAKATLSFGLETRDLETPQRIIPKHNHPYDSSAEELDYNVDRESGSRCSGGGRLPKKRKPRALSRPIQNNHQNLKEQQQQQFRNPILTLDQIVNEIKTSDSDASELENSVTDNGFIQACSAHERQKNAKVRLQAITLLGTVVTHLQDQHVLFGYWHAFFENTKIPTNDSQQRRNDLLYTALHDPNTRCRAAALQIARQLIFSSKNFLRQAECDIERLPTAFLPFAHSLGLQVVSMFEELTKILVAESSLPVLTQALKCLAALVQATTPFQRYQPRNFIEAFVKEIQRLVAHRDTTIQVAALMVLEFLITAPELTPEISNAIGATHHIRNGIKDQHLNNENAENLLEINNSFDEHIESDSEDDGNIVTPAVGENIKPVETDTNALTAQNQLCWLLQRVLQNLGAYPMQTGRVNSISSLTSVRIESLQVLGAMAQHFMLLENHLDRVAIAIQNAMTEPLTDLRICAARCLDTIVYQIGAALLGDATKRNVVASRKQCNQLEIDCLQFWEKLLPTIIDQIGSSAPDMTSSIKVCLCDALSNIGIVVFEKQSYAAQMNLVGFLSGIACDSNEDAIVRCAAVRALAVYVLFPSLRDNLVFIENAAELTLRMITDTNIVVRVKASWALGNISDALVINGSNGIETASAQERISDDLLWRLISAASEACNDNDKVRCNAVRTLGNLLRLVRAAHLNAQNTVNNGNQMHFQNAISKLIDCLRVNGSSKVKWNTCYAIGNLLQNADLFGNSQMNNNFDWQSKLYSALAKVIVHHPNFKVRINAATALTKVTTRAHFGIHYEVLWKTLLDAIEQSYHLDNFYEYNHRDHLQEQLCLAISHMLHCAQSDDFILLCKYLKDHEEVLESTWRRVVNRMVPEKSAPIVASTAFLHQQIKDSNANFSMEQRNAINSIIRLFKTQ